MPDDVNMSAEQEDQDEMSTDELEALFDQDEEDYEDEDNSPGGDDDTTDEDADDNSGEGEDDEDDDADGTDDSDDDAEQDDDAKEVDEDGEDAADDDDDDDDPLSDVKARAAQLKKDEEKAEADKLASQKRQENLEATKADVLNDLFGSGDMVKIGDKEVDLKSLTEDYGEDLDTLITARAFQIAQPLVEKALENAGFASSEELQALKDENENYRFMSQVAQVHPEAWQLQADDKFWNWVDAQGDDVKTLMDRGGVEGATTVIAAYKKASIQNTNKKIDADADNKQKKHKSLHTSTIRTKGSGKRKSGKKSGGQLSESEARDLFNEVEIED